MNTSSEEIFRLGSIAASLVHDVSHLVHAMGYENVEKVGLKLSESPALYQLQRVLSNTQRQLSKSSLQNCFCLLEATQNVHSLLKSKFMQEKIDFSCKFSEKDQNFFVVLNQAQIEQMLMNFFLNSCGAFLNSSLTRNRKKKITLTFLKLKSKKQIKLTIKDNACGMNEEQLEDWRNTLHSVSTNTAEKPMEFKGLGKLIISRAIQESKAKVEIKSRFGGGTTFTLYFAAAK